MLDLWGGHLAADSMQFGFRQGLSNAHCSWLVMEVCWYFQRRKSKVCVALMDYSMPLYKCLFEEAILLKYKTSY